MRHAAGLRDAGGANDCGLAHAAFVKPTLASAQREIASGARPSASKRAKATVIAEENDDGVFVELELLELGQKRTNAVVHRRNHRGQGRVVLSQAVGAIVLRLGWCFALERLGRLGLIMVDVFLVRLNRSVDVVVGEV